MKLKLDSLSNGSSESESLSTCDLQFACNNLEYFSL